MIKRLAPAKINLFLHILGKRNDGYHDLESLIAFADIGDEIIIEPANKFCLKIQGPFAQDIHAENNSVMSAAHWIAQQTNQNLDAQITLTKNLPIASGIGGGSSDAASVILALLEYWQIDNSFYAFTLGADVPVCLYGQPAMIKGTGEKYEPFSLTGPLHVVLVNPLIPCPTTSVFQSFQGPYSKPFADPKKTFIDWISDKKNDLQKTAIKLVPQISDILEILDRTHGCFLHRMSGSGATCFGLFETYQTAKMAEENILREHPDWWVQACTIK